MPKGFPTREVEKSCGRPISKLLNGSWEPQPENQDMSVFKYCRNCTRENSYKSE